MKTKLIIGQEYEACNQFATLERIEGDTAIMRNRWDTTFETDIGNVREKPKVKAIRKPKAVTKVALNFMVVPEQLRERAYVPNPIRVRILQPDSTALLNLLGDSGRKLAKAGVEFDFTGDIAARLIFLGVAEEVNPTVSMAKIDKIAREIWGLPAEREDRLGKL